MFLRSLIGACLLSASLMGPACGQSLTLADDQRPEWLRRDGMVMAGSWEPLVLTCSALEMTGINEIWQTVTKFYKKLTASGELDHKRQKQALDWMWSLVEDGLKERFNTNPEIKNRIERIARSVKNGEIAATLAADKLLFFLDNQGSA